MISEMIGSRNAPSTIVRTTEISAWPSGAFSVIVTFRMPVFGSVLTVARSLSVE